VNADSGFRNAFAASAVMSIMAACTPAESRPTSLTDRDRAEIRANDSAYVTSWLRDDTTGVLATLTADPVLIPGGLAPLQGLAAVKGFWWPSDGSHTKILAFGRTIEEIDGNGDVAFVRGADSLRFTYTKGTSSQESAMRSVTLAVVRRQPDGTWKIARMMWATVTH
jgi:ketosteroid isomerase-like protein